MRLKGDEAEAAYRDHLCLETPMKPLPAALLAAALYAAAFATYAAAPAASAASAAACPRGMVSGPAGCGPASAPGARAGATRWGRNTTPGWGMMSAAERDEHRRQMGSFTTYEACKTYVDQHRTQMAERAKERGMAMPAAHRRDPCAGLPKAG